MNLTTYPAFSVPRTGKKSIQQLSGEDYASPGPIYNTFGLGAKHKSVSHTIGKSARTEINHWVESNPSPHHYNPQKQKISQKITFTKSNRKEEINNNPDPAFYKPIQKNTKPKVLQYSMGAKYGSIMDDVNKNPGPGHYETIQDINQKSLSKSNSKDKLFGLSKRFSQGQLNLPAPGSYEITSKTGMISNKGTIGKGHRQMNIDITPGPSDYPKKSFAQQAIENKVGKTISSRFKGCFNENTITSQAFNKYHQVPLGQSLDFKSTKIYSIGKEQRVLFKDNKNPGPSEYITDQFKIKQEPHVGMAKAERRQYNDVINHPGPGSYQPISPKGKTYSIPKSKSTANFANTPGVARYQITKGIETINNGYRMPKSSRTNFISRNTAGVGDYDIIQKSGPKGTIGKAQRFKKLQGTKPGPGDYHIHPTIANLHHYTNKNK